MTARDWSRRLRALSADPVTTLLVGRARRLPQSRRPSILLACLPKSASSTFVRLLVQSTALDRSFLAQDAGDDHHLDLSRLVDRHRHGYVARHHLVADASTLRLVRQFDLRVVALTRDIFDMLVSFRDHCRRDGLRNPIVYLPPHFGALSGEEQLSMIVAGVAPWVVGFVKSWEEAERRGLRVSWVDYLDVTTEPERTVRRTLADLEVPVVEAGLSRALTSAPRRFNVGRPGRGRELIAPEQQVWINRLADQFELQHPERIGLTEHRQIAHHVP